ncbi:hypothetical protein U91I_02193 [alpha proteobacterium U9-1i]|nr:hypothetical protein U91I_02193 [alpha proteobacterium U9-1i]
MLKRRARRLHGKARQPLGLAPRAAAAMLKLDARRGRLKQHAPARVHRAAAKIEIGGVGGEGFVEATQFLKVRARHEHERTRHSCDTRRLRRVTPAPAAL